MAYRFQAFGVYIDSLDLESAAEKCLQLAKKRDKKVSYVVTPNVDHIVMLQENDDFVNAYLGAALATIDGRPVRKALQWLGETIPEVVTGSDLVPAIFDAVAEGDSLTVFLLGSMPGVAQRAGLQIENRWPRVKIVGYYSPPLGFEHDEEENLAILEKIALHTPDVIILGVGAPKQELWTHKNASRIDAGVLLCAGATIDFLAKEKNRAPKWMQLLSLEWLFRLISEPRRLFLRYARDAFVFPGIVLQEYTRRRKL